MAKEFQRYLGELTVCLERREPKLEVALLGPDKLNDEQRWAREYLKAQGSLLKAPLRPPTEPTRPFAKDRQEMLLHYTLKVDGTDTVLHSTRKEDGGTGVPHTFILGKYTKEVFGLELGLRQIQPGERCLFKILADYAYEHPKTKERGISPPPGVDCEATLLYDVELLDYYDVKIVDFDDALVIKKETEDGEGWWVVATSMPRVERWAFVCPFNYFEGPPRVLAGLTGALCIDSCRETPRSPFEVEVTFEGFTLCGDGDKQFQPPTTLKYCVGDGQLPLGLEMGINTMNKNEKAWIRCRGKFQMGAGVVTNVPSTTAAPDGILYRVHLHDFMQVRDLFGDGRIHKRRVKLGTGEFPADAPMMDCTVRCHFVARTLPDRTVVYDSYGEDRQAAPLEFDIGGGMYPPALETSVRLMCPNETSLVIGRTRDLYEASHLDMIPVGVSHDQQMEWQVFLDSFDKPVNWYKTTFEEALKDSEKSKEQGNTLFNKGSYRLAKAKYHKTAAQIDGLRGLTSEQFQTMEAIKVSCHLNYAQCCIKQEEYHEAIQRLSEKVLKHTQDNPKGLYRRAVSYIATGFFEEARADIEGFRQCDPESSRDADLLLARCKREEQAFKVLEKNSYSGKLYS